MGTENDDSNQSRNVQTRELHFVGGARKELEELYSSVPRSKAKQIATCISFLTDGQAPSLDIRHLHVSKGYSAMEIRLKGSPALRVVYTMKQAGKMIILYAGKKTAEGTDRALISTVEARLKMI
ncbi:type II toxin-antitoxin system RelE/ParE family toxin [Stenotrophomonas sp. RG-453]|uniref:type II toxin-antitoxin system RelE/ParE family toxin n=1 Tax=Stenotrophomonas sp. RG-453 TaxID=2957502 RepID=UPI0029CA2333|nr:type II toxin-antitoxin system RelE/ParE family toxin [Stenotrophomonas sp. RG-453]MDX5515826.1 type II toxin-antitoxin system RelE/ParE family toxin [Stenotrophomonas sp. RG-453]